MTGVSVLHACASGYGMERLGGQLPLSYGARNGCSRAHGLHSVNAWSVADDGTFKVADDGTCKVAVDAWSWVAAGEKFQ